MALVKIDTKVVHVEKQVVTAQRTTSPGKGKAGVTRTVAIDQSGLSEAEKLAYADRGIWIAIQGKIRGELEKLPEGDTLTYDAKLERSTGKARLADDEVARRAASRLLGHEVKLDNPLVAAILAEAAKHAA